MLRSSLSPPYLTKLSLIIFLFYFEFSESRDSRKTFHIPGFWVKDHVSPTRSCFWSGFATSQCGWRDQHWPSPTPTNLYWWQRLASSPDTLPGAKCESGAIEILIIIYIIFFYFGFFFLCNWFQRTVGFILTPPPPPTHPFPSTTVNIMYLSSVLCSINFFSKNLHFICVVVFTL